MGGGGAMRAAAKVAGVGVVNGVRGTISSVPPPAEHSVRNASLRPVSAIISSSHNGTAPSGVELAGSQRPTWELDDWEFAGVEEELMFDTAAAEPMPRLVFGGAPSLQEAKSATSDLKDALDKVYLSSPGHKGSDGSLGLAQPSGVTSITHDSAANHAMQAFSLFSESPAVQTVVASIASDPNVWDAVLQNKDLTVFLGSCKTTGADVEFDNMESPREFSDVKSEDQGSTCKLSELSDDSSETGNSENGTPGFMENVKNTVVEMVSGVSSYLENIFGFSSAENKSAAAADGNARPTFVEKTLGASFVGLAVMVIMVVVLKRP